MVFEHLRVKPGMRITSAWGNAIVDAIEKAYGFGVTSVKYEDLARLGYDIVPDADNLRDLGSEERAWAEVHAHRGVFREEVLVQGRPVIKDGDPITVQYIGEPAREAITRAIDEARISRLASIRIDEYGNVGIIIAEPIDFYGRVRTVVEDAYEPVSARTEVAASENTYGVELTLETRGRPNINVYVRVGGAAEARVYVSNDAARWRLLDTISFAGAGEELRIYTGMAFRYVRVHVPTAGVDVEIEVAASR